MRRRTYQQRRWPTTPVFQAVASSWCDNQSYLLLDLVWRAADDLRERDLSNVPVNADDEAKEESLNFMLWLHIDRLKTGDEPFGIVHQPPEQSKRKSRNAQSPTPDLGFVWHGNPNCVWPIEGKVLNDEDDLDPYEKEVNDNFLSGRYATFSFEGAMIGYLMYGSTAQVLKNAARKLRKRFSTHPSFPDRDHRISKHERKGVEKRPKEIFFCHHLMLAVY